jgi:hypothetical protein
LSEQERASGFAMTRRGARNSEPRFAAIAQVLEFFINVALWDVFLGPIWN